MKDLESLPPEERERLRQTGLEMDFSRRSGSYFQKDQEVVHATSTAEGVEIMGLSEALEKYDGLKDYYWKAVSPEKDRVTKFVAKQQEPRGVVVIAREGAKTTLPLQACLYLSEETIQHVHNLFIAEQGAEVHIISGCASASYRYHGSHMGVSEFYIDKNAHITSTMIHNWGDKITVFPRSAAVVGENGLFLSNYVCMNPVRKIEMYPTATLAGENAVARFSSVVMAHPNSHLDIGSRAILSGRRTSAELITRAITRGGTVISRGHIVGASEGTRGHIECRGLILEDGLVHAIPEIEGRVVGTELSHEAAVGKIAQDEIDYLISRGLDEEVATATIIRGFLDVKIQGLPDALQQQIDAAIDAAERGF
ncbi:MAG: SufD family Fe-S cluster assembly protein [Methanomicrobiaceae archaeon]|nr:SufD family Fe-S cluster assembly protein [Methanomicrobiaceae archaeon]